MIRTADLPCAVRPRRALRQQGVVFYLFVIFLLMTSAVFIGVGRYALDRYTDREAVATRVLDQARELVLAQLLQPNLQGAAVRLGDLALLPDLPRNAGAGVDATEPNYDGLAETGLCASRTWNPGQALAPAATQGANARCFGRLPWQQFGLGIDMPRADDPAGELPWLIVSPNLAIGSACLRNLNPMVLGATFTGYGCPSDLPFPWLQVRDARGNLISDRVAFALILPGPSVPGQVRSATAGPAAWLDQATIRADCAQPCVPGTYNNANYRHANDQPWVLIKAAQDGPLVTGNTLYQLPHSFNDRLVFVTIDELFERLQAQAARTVEAALKSFRATYGHYPYAAPFNDPTAACQPGLRFGHPPLLSGGCAVAEHLDLPTWLTDAGWQRAFVYAVSPRCNAGNAACNAPGLVVDARNDVDALLFTAGTPIQRAPFAAARGAAQRPLTAGVLSPLAADWLDTPENAGGTPDVYVSPVAGATPVNDRILIVE